MRAPSASAPRARKITSPPTAARWRAGSQAVAKSAIWSASCATKVLESSSSRGGRIEKLVQAVLAQVQIGRAVEVGNCQEAGALLPVEAQAALRIGAGKRADRGGHAQVATAGFAFQLGQVDALATILSQAQVEADQVRIVVVQLVPAADMGAHGFEVTHGAIPAERT